MFFVRVCLPRRWVGIIGHGEVGTRGRRKVLLLLLFRSLFPRVDLITLLFRAYGFYWYIGLTAFVGYVFAGANVVRVVLE